MKKALAKLSFTPLEDGKLKIPSVPVWYNTTWGVEPNNWSIRVSRQGDIQPDNTMIAEIDFLVEGANYLLKQGTTFKLRSLGVCNCQVEIIKEL